MKKLTESLLLLQKKHTKAKGRSASQKDGNDSQYLKTRSFVLQQFCKISKPQKLKINSGKDSGITATIIDDFTLLTNPEQTLKFISDLSNIGQNKKVHQITIDHSLVPKHDLSAEVLLAQSVLSIRTKKRQNKNKISIKGIYPNNPDLAPMLDSIGIVQQIKADKTSSSEINVEKTKVFKAKCTEKEDVDFFSSDKKTQATINFIKYMDDCLKAVNRKMTEDAGGELSAIIGELIGNAEDHADIDENHWQFYGYMDKNSKGEIYQQISIFNFGKSIAQTFIDKRNVTKINDRVSGYTKLHKDKFSIEELLTVMAFQENVSSKLDIDSTRGQGFTDLLLFFESITQECTKNGDKHIEMSVISGNVYIYFDGKYVPLMDDISKRHLVYLNENNDFMQPPDSKYIQQMKTVNFPGTIITIKFHLKESDTEILEQTNESEKETNS